LIGKKGKKRRRREEEKEDVSSNTRLADKGYTCEMW
jgi:hypothetical protein